MNKISSLLNSIPIFESWSRGRKIGRLKQKYELWKCSGGEIPLPHYGKQLVVADYSQCFDVPVLVETGTYHGHMVMAMLDRFKEIYSIELDVTLCSNAQRQFSRHRHIHILQGSSDQVLPLVLPQIKQSCLFWLDAHYSGGKTAKGELSTPIMKELGCILQHPLAARHVLLIDDARCFVGDDDYPTLVELRDYVLGKYPDWSFEVKDDIIRVHSRCAVNQ